MSTNNNNSNYRFSISFWIYLVVIFVGLITTPFVEVEALQVTVLDTTKMDTLGWVTYSADDDGSGRRGWKEASYTDTDGDVFRIYTVCNVANVAVDNWLRMPYVQRNDANRLYVEVRFTMRKCTRYPDPGRLQQCKESFKLRYYEADSDFANAMMPTWDDATYRHVDVVAADKVFTDVNDVVINTETRSVPVSVQGVYFAFEDEGACTTILSVRVFYVVCDDVTVNYSVFPRTPTGLELTSIVQSDGVCVDHAAIDQQPSYLCQADGKWYYPTGGCKCLPGYQPERQSKECVACPVGTYKWTSSNDRCLPCPSNSDSPSEGAVQCRCLKGFYRAPYDDRSGPCTGPPSFIQNLTVTYFDQSMISLSWTAPLDLGFRDDLRYRVYCLQCDDFATFLPAQSEFNTTNITVLGLGSNRQYTFSVFVENGVTTVSSSPRRTDVTVMTAPPVPLRVINVQVTAVGTDYIGLAWNQCSGVSAEIGLTWNQYGGIPTEKYEVKCWSMDGNENTTSVFSNTSNVTLNQLAQQTKYMLMVRCRTEKGWGEFSNSVFAVTGHVFQYPVESPIAIIAGSVVAVFFCLIIGLIIIILFIRRNRRSSREKTAVGHSEYSNLSPQFLGSTLVNSVAAPVGLQAATGNRTYIDPHTYEDPNEAVRDFTKEIDVSYVIIESVIGGGEFGNVCKGTLRIPGKNDLCVAIKTLKAGASVKASRDFLTEASIMGQFDDPNVIYLEGVVTTTTPIMILTEYMSNGSLDKFLKTNDANLTILQLVGMMRGIASGMRYLSEMGFIHRDLAARNILVSETLICKVSDFGLSREVESDSSTGTYTTKGGKIPIRWTAPEAIAYRKFTSASDVWSYGVVMWEVMSYGEWPYWNWTNQDVILAIDSDYRLPPPMDCPDAIYQLMRDCWQKERGQRPRFTVIVRTLDKLIRTPEKLKELGQQSRSFSTSQMQTAANSGVARPFGTVDEWLVGIKMERYEDVFKRAGYRTIEDVSRIRHADLLQLGITLAGHQKKIQNVVHALQTTDERRNLADVSFV